jgi:hypothetical protein
VRVLPHITKLDDAFGQFLVRATCVCGASRHIEPAFLARLVGPTATPKVAGTTAALLALWEESGRGRRDREAEATGADVS